MGRVELGRLQFEKVFPALLPLGLHAVRGLAQVCGVVREVAQHVYVVRELVGN